MKLQDTEYELLGIKIQIKFVDNAEVEDRWVYGYTHAVGDTTTIVISKKDIDGGAITKESMIRTIRHELFHAIMDRGQYFNSSSDEPLVEWLATCTDILHKQGAVI